MLELDNKDILNLYLLLSDEGDLSERFNPLLVKLEKEIFQKYSVKEIEGYRELFIKKGRL